MYLLNLSISLLPPFPPILLQLLKNFNSLIELVGKNVRGNLPIHMELYIFSILYECVHEKVLVDVRSVMLNERRLIESDEKIQCLREKILE